MIRVGGGDFAKILPIYSKYNAGWYNWGLVAGRSQCYNYMNQPLGTTIPKVWCCEVFWPDGKPYDPEEIKLIRNFRFQELPDAVKSFLPQTAR